MANLQLCKGSRLPTAPGSQNDGDWSGAGQSGVGSGCALEDVLGVLGLLSGRVLVCGRKLKRTRCACTAWADVTVQCEWFATVIAIGMTPQI